MFYFIFSPNNSGTTIMTQYLAQQCDGFLPSNNNNEGQRMPAVAKMMLERRWEPDQAFDWSVIRNHWQAAMAKAGKTVFVEASPPNMVRVAAIREAFAGDMRAVFSIADPCLYVASCIKNYETAIDDDILRRHAEAWISKAAIQRDNILRWPDIPRISYEQFCRDPAVLNAAFGRPVVTQTPYAGKSNSRVSHILDMTARNIAFLMHAEVAIVVEALAPHADLLGFFGYRVMDAAGYDATMHAQPDLALAGRDDRRDWVLKPRATRLLELKTSG